MRILRLLPFHCGIALLAALCGAPHVAAQQTPSRTAAVPAIPSRYRPDPPSPGSDSLGLRFRLSQGTAGVAGAAPSAPSVAPIPAAEARRLLGRLPPLRRTASAADSFAFPAQSPPPPRAGATVHAAFPSREGAAGPPPAVPSGGALEVVRRSPEGRVEGGAGVTVVFSRAMVPLGAPGQTASEVPARLAPQPPGRWRWLDARTLVFEPAGRMPMSTRFTVEVPAGTRAADGAVLARAVAWSFTTAAPFATGAYPNAEPAAPQPVLVVTWNGEVDAAAALPALRLEAGGGEHPLRPATPAEIEADPRAREIVRGQPAGRWTAFRPVRPLPADTPVRVTVGAGAAPGGEPAGSAPVQEWSFRTHGPLRVAESKCGREEQCRPEHGWSIRFSNPLDPGSWSDSLLRVEPAVPGLRVDLQGDRLYLAGGARPNTVHRIHLHPSIRDRFGQALGAHAPVEMAVGPAAGRIWMGAQGLAVLDPAGPARVPFYTSDVPRVRLRIHRVRPEDWAAFASRGLAADALPGVELVSRVVETGGAAGAVAETTVDLAPFLEGGLGHFLLAVEPVEPGSSRWWAFAWVQSTRIGLATVSDGKRLSAWATSLADGAPLAGVELRVPGAPAAAVTGADGLAVLALPDSGAREVAVVARRGKDVAILPAGLRPWERNRGDRLAWYLATDRHLYRPGEEVRFKGWVRRLTPGADAQPVLPGPDADSVRFTIRDAEWNSLHRGTLRLSALGGFDGRFTIPAGATLGSAAIRVEAPDLSTGWQAEGEHEFEVQEFRRAEFVAAVEAGAGPHLAGGSAEVVARASYFGGGGLPDAEVRWTASAEPAAFTPPGWDRWSFGDAASTLGREHGTPVVRVLDGRTDAAGAHTLRLDFERATPPLPAAVEVEATVTDVNRQTWTAEARLLVHPAEVYAGLRTARAWVEPGRPVEWEVVVVDLSGRPVAGREVEVWAGGEPGRWDAGEWTPDPRAQSCRLVSAAAPLRCTFRPTAGGPFYVAARVRDAAGRPSWTVASVWVSGAAARRPEPGRPAEGAVEMVADRAEYLPGDTAEVLLRAPLFPARGMLTLIRAGIARSQPLEVKGATHVLRVPIGEGDVPNLRLRVDLAGDARGPAGDSATVLPTDFAAGTLELKVPPTRRALAVRATPRDTLAAPDARTGVEVEVRDAAGRPVRAAEVALLVVDEAVLALSGYRHPDPLEAFHPRRENYVTVERLRNHVLLAPRDLPAAPGTLVGTVTDARTGRPLGGAAVEVRETGARAATDGYGRFRLAGVRPGTYTLVASREGLPPAERTVRVGAEAHPPLRFALGSAGDPQSIPGAPALELQALVVTGVAAAPPPFPAGEAMYRGVPDGDEPGGSIALRTNFNALAHFSPAVRTDAAGRARVAVQLPSSLTRYRVVAAGVAGDRLSGLGESSITTRRELMARPSPPRFLNVGDRFELPVTVQNYTSRALEVDVAVRAEGLEVDSAGRRVTVPAGDRVEVRFPAAATRPGVALVQVAAAGGGLADAAEVELPVWVPASAEAFATYGAVDSGTVVLPLRVPSGVLPGYGGLEVTTSSTAVQELTDALLYLVRYPFECTEQVASRLASVAALRDVLAAFRTAEMPAPEALRASVDRDVAALARLQNGDGGWGFWRRGEPSWPFVSVHVAHALQRAREKGYAVPEEVMAGAARYLREVEQRAASYPERERRAVAAYAAYTRARMGDEGAAASARRLLDGAAPGTLSLEARGWILSALAGRPEHREAAAGLVRELSGQARETAATASFADAYAQGEYLLLHSARRTDAVVLDALIAAAPASDLIPKTVRGLLGHRRAGRWASTQENAWVLFALDRYFAAYEDRTPDFQARAWLGGRYAGGHRFSGRTTERHHLAVPMRALPAADTAASLVLERRGTGRMYYRAGLRWAPASAELDAARVGFTVERTYEAVDDSADVRHGADGAWRIRAGARVRVRLTLTAPGRRHHVALADPLPGGLEPLNPELRGTQGEPDDDGDDDGGPAWRGSWWEHQNLRDERAEAFTSLLPPGVYGYSYLARATTPGSFVVPPARAEEMYSPETFGRTATGRVVVEAR